MYNPVLVQNQWQCQLSSCLLPANLAWQLHSHFSRRNAGMTHRWTVLLKSSPEKASSGKLFCPLAPPPLDDLHSEDWREEICQSLLPIFFVSLVTFSLSHVLMLAISPLSTTETFFTSLSSSLTAMKPNYKFEVQLIRCFGVQIEVLLLGWGGKSKRIRARLSHILYLV